VMHVLITGGTGFIGSRLALRCLERGDAVRILGQQNNAAEAEASKNLRARGAEIILDSVTNQARVFAVTRDVDLVYHLAAAQHEANVPDQHFWNVNVAGTQNLLEASEQSGVKRFVHGSTIGVYGATSVGIIDEQSPLQPMNIYGRTKLEGERRVLSFQERLPVVIARISETYGPGDYRLLKLFKAIQKRLFFMIGDGRNKHHLIYIDDLIDCLFLTAAVPEAIGNTFVLAGKEIVTTQEMVSIISEQLGKRMRKYHFPLFPFLVLATAFEYSFRLLKIQPPLHRRRMDFFRNSFVLSHEKSSKLLGFTPQRSFKEGIAETATWYTTMGYLSSSP
jgi:nucleoside-diphosphate-sugar epimerase